jgi:glycopeptide antibiotics resistance protein
MYKRSFYCNRIINIFIITLTIIYVLIMIKLLFLRRHSYYWDSYNYNLIPLETIKRYIFNRHSYNQDIWVKNLFGNIILFIPLGLAIPTLNKKYMRVSPFIILVLLILISVELIQMFTKVGSLDIDDIILNAFGALIGFGVIRLIVSIFVRHRN